MNVAIMQPYFLPYIGYYQLLHAVDVFVVYDNIKYTKKGWINRNRILCEGRTEYISLPLKKDSDSLEVRQRVLADSFPEAREKMLRKLEACYRSAPHFARIFPWLAGVLRKDECNLFQYLHAALEEVRQFLGLAAPLVVSSTVEVDAALAGEDRVIATCRALGADTYVNLPGGRDLYSHEAFARAGVRLRFLDPELREYPQGAGPFVPGLSIVDVLMCNDADQVAARMTEYRLD